MLRSRSSKSPADRGHAAVRREVARLRAILDSAMDAVVGMDQSGTINRWSPSAEKMFGWGAVEAIERPLQDLIVPERYRAAHLAGMRRFIETGEGPVLQRRIELSGLRRDGTEIPIELMVTAFRENGRHVFNAFISDVSARHESERALRASEQRFRALVEHSWDGISLRTADGRILYVSPSIERILGYAPEDLIGRSFTDFIHPDDVAIGIDAVKQLLGRPGAMSRFSLRTLHRDGTWRLIAATSINHLESPGIGAIVSNFHDFTERRQAEVARERSDERYRELFENAPVGIYQASHDGRILAANAEFARLLGYGSPEQLRSVNMRELYFDPNQRDRMIRGFEESGRAGDVELDWRRRDGTRVTVQLSAHAARSADGSLGHFEGFIRDVSQRVQLEAQLRQSQKMEAVGQLAGGVAHDFNNLLTAILGYSDLLRGELKPDDPGLVRLEEIRRAGERAAALTHQLLAFSRRQVLQPRVLDLNEIVADVNQLLQRLIGEDIRIVSSCAPDLPPVRVDPHQMQQVLINLAINARDAMPDGGQLRIETREAMLDDDFVSAHPGAKPGPHVLLSIADTGMGMDAETQSHIFEPFFTTKEPGKGTGLGLSMVYGIVEQSGGFVHVASEPHRGTVFNIYLPRSSEAPVEASADHPQDDSLRGEGTVLVVEDDAAVRDLVRDMLESAGYQVIACGRPEEARLAARKHEGEIQMLVTDVVMPGGGGRALAEALQHQRPALRVLFMSGYAGRTPLDPRGQLAGAEYIQKPFDRIGLLRQVHGLIAVERPTRA
ncbi:MAG: PAS domain S-box protein [Candidatus Eisenbacteria bacterium]|nr:PAS domain S-box protein [Candidatus Eisenbacteria bacterium]